MGGPSPYVVLPDPLVSRAAVATYSEAGSDRYCGPAVPDSANNGSLVPFCDGSPQDDLDMVFRLLRSGGLYENAEWCWRRSTDSTSQYRGQEDDRRLSRGNDPFAGTSAPAYGVASVTSTTLRRVFCYRWSAGSTWNVRWRPFDSDPDAWQSSTAVFLGASNASVYDLLSVEELDDGVLCAAVATGTNVDSDVDIYHSTDGFTWTRVAREIIATWGTGVTVGVYRMRLHRSRGWLRLLMVDGLTNDVLTYVSSDRGASWVPLTNVITGTENCRNNGQLVDYYVCDLVGTDSADGGFWLVLIENASASAIRWYYAARSDDWGRDTDWNETLGNVVRITCCRDAHALWVFYCRDDGTTGAYWTAQQVSRRDPLDVTNRVQVGGAVPTFGGCQKYSPTWVDAVVAGHAVLFTHALGNPDHATPGTLVNGYCAQQLAGWSRRPLHRREPLGLASTSLFSVYWNACCGAPQGSFGSPHTPLTLENNAATTNWNSDRQQIQDSAAAGYHRYVLDEGLAPSFSWSDASLHEWVVRGDDCKSGAADKVGARVVGYTASPATSQTDVSLRVQSTPTPQVVVYDNVAGATLATVVLPSITSKFHEVRWAQRKVGSAYLGQLWVSQLGDTPGQDTGGLTLTLGTSGLTSHQALKWGHLAGDNAGQSSLWREWGLCRNDDYQQVGFVNPTNLRGHLASPWPVYVSQGWWTWWGGGGGMEGDWAQAAPLYHHGLDALFVDSPAMDYRTTSTGAGYIVLDAQAAGRGQWMHDAAGLFGVTEQSLWLHYNDTDVWTGPAAAETLSSVAYTGITVAEVRGDAMRVHDPLARYPDGVLTGLRASVTGLTALEVSHHLGTWVQMAGVTDLGLLGWSAGATLSFLTTRAISKFTEAHRYRFLRISWASGKPFGGYHGLGSVVLGRALDFDVPMNWVHGDKETGNVALEGTESGLRVADEQGDPRRSITATVPGDANRYRERWRALVRALAGYARRPMVLVMDSERAAATGLLVRYMGASDDKNVAWYRDDSGNWRTAGDMDLAFDEEV